MWNRLLTYRRLAWAALLSLLLHVLLLGRLLGWLPEEESTADPIQIELAQVSAHPDAPPQALPPPVRALRRAPPPAAPAKPPAPPPPVPAAPELAAPVPAAAPAPTAVAAEPKAVPAEPPPAAAEPAVEAEAPAPAEESVPPPRHVEIDFRILHKGSEAGVERQRYQVRDDGSYLLSSVAEPRGLLSLALSDLLQQSEGRVTEQGLQPTSFIYQYGKSAAKAQKAQFDWQAGNLQLESGSRKQTVALLEGAQDLMSFMYQFMFSPPLQQMSLAITNGKRLKIYAYTFEGEETLATKMGELRSYHILRESGDGEEKTELWLAADYHYLPIKIRKVEKDGTATERIAVRLQLN